MHHNVCRCTVSMGWLPVLRELEIDGLHLRSPGSVVMGTAYLQYLIALNTASNQIPAVGERGYNRA